MDPFKNKVDDRTSYTDLDEQFYDARLAKDTLTQADWPSQIDRAAIDVTYGVALGTTDSAFDHGATIGRMDFGTACGPHYVDGLRALAGSQSDLPELISEHDASDIGDLVFRLNELRPNPYATRTDCIPPYSLLSALLTIGSVILDWILRS